MESLNKKEKLFFARVFLGMSMALTAMGFWLSTGHLGHIAYTLIFLGLGFAFVKIESIRDYFHSER